MSYPGDRALDPVVQQRIMTAFGEAVRLYREGHAEECRTILRSILEIDPAFVPAQRLSSAVASGAPVDLGELLGQVTAGAAIRPEEYLAKARGAMAARDFQAAVVILQELLRELPGLAEARTLLAEAQQRGRATTEAQGYLQRARQALEVGMADAAHSFLEAAERLDPSHPELAELREAAERLAREGERHPDFEFSVRSGEAGPGAAGAAPGTAAGGAAPVQAATEALPSPSQEAREGGAVAGSGGFEAAASEFVFSAAEEAEAPARSDERIAALLQQGQEAFEHGDFAAAIDTWSRIYLIDPHHEEAGQRIEEARRRREEVERLAEHRFFEARDAFEQGRLDEARRLCQEVLELQPQHLDAHDLLQRLETPAAPPPPPMPSLEVGEEDLFRDDFVPAKTPISGSVPVTTPAAAAVAAPRPAPARPAAPRLAGLPLPLVAAVAGALVLLLAVGLLLRGKLFGSAESDIQAGLAEAEKLAGQGQFQQAVTLLQSLEVEGEAANQVRQRLLEYQRQLRSAKTATTPDEAKVARQALGEGRRVQALLSIRQGLAKVPGDKELEALRAEITAVHPVLPALAEAVSARDYERVRTHAASLLSALPGDAEGQRLWTAATFDLAVAQLRKYQVASAYALLQELTARGDDPEAVRLKEFAATYRSRPVDPRYQIFVASIEMRPLE